MTYPLGDIDIDVFLRDYWHKKPLLIRNALPDVKAPVDADELAGLALDEEVESRLIQFNPKADDWHLDHGPLAEERFSELPEKNWTLLVQGVDHWVPEAADLLEQFNFIPNWRVDDLMISYAVDGGGVGPHYDNYDVFLIQTSGTRRWELGPLCDENSPRRDNTPVMILPEWNPEVVYELNPGDILYLPPRVAHNGIAVGDDCMTCSVGFRAPAYNEILRSFSDFVGEPLGREQRYADPDLPHLDNAGEITPQALSQVQSILQRYLNDEKKLREWFGRFVTSPKYPELQPDSEPVDFKDLKRACQAPITLVHNEGSRYSYIDESDRTLLFVDGECYPTTGSCRLLARELCRERHINLDVVADEDALKLLHTLLEAGLLYLEDDAD